LVDRFSQWHYDVSASAKPALSTFLAASVTPADMAKWAELLVMLRTRLGLPRASAP